MGADRLLQQPEQSDATPLTLVTPHQRGFAMLVDAPRVDQYEKHGHENYSADLLLGLSNGVELLVDVGAHFGFYTLLLGARDRNLRILALEPCEENFAVLRRNIEHNGLVNVETLCLAASDSAGAATFRVADNSGLGGFYEPFLGRTVKEVEVKTVALDTLLADAPNTPAMVKIDTEGHEILVLQGMEKTLARMDDVRLLVEFNPEMQKRAGYDPKELLDELFDFGFDVYFIEEERRRYQKLARTDVERWPELIGSLFNANLLCIKQPRSLSICLFSHSAGLGGAERSLLQLVTELIRDHGILCTVVLPSEGPLKHRLEAVGAATLVAGYPWWCKTSREPDVDPGSVMAEGARLLVETILPALEQVNPDVFLTNTMVIPWGALSAMVLGRPHVWFVREFGEEDHGLDFFLPLQSVRKFIRDHSNIVLTNSDAVRESMDEDSSAPDSMTVYMDVEMPPSPPSTGALRHFTTPSAAKLLVLSGIAPGKGQQDAVLAVAALTARGHDVELLVMGWRNPEYLEKLQTIVNEKELEARVRFEEFREDPYPVMAEADIVLVCSRKEAFGRVALEAMLLGKPVVASNAGGLPEIVRDGSTGFLYESGNPEDLADKVEALIRDPKLRASFGRKGLEIATERFTAAGYGGKVALILMGLKNEFNPVVGDWLAKLGLPDAVFQLRAKRERLTQQLAEKEQAVQQLRAELAAEQGRLTQQLAEKEQAAQTLQAQVAQLKAEQERLTQQLADITGSTAWALVRFLWQIRLRMAPRGSLREAFLRLGMRALRIWWREGSRALLRKAAYRVLGRHRPGVRPACGRSASLRGSGQCKVGVVVVTHNAAQAARVTLASLRRATNATPYEVVLVDNASHLVERETIRRAFSQHVAEAGLPWRYVQLEENRGFAGGNNIGIQMFLADSSISHICLLNSDVIVPDYWLDRLIEKGVDMVSPVTNKADSVQCVLVDYDVDLMGCLEEATQSIAAPAFGAVNTFAQNRFRTWRGNVVPIDVTTFCCVLFTKDLVQRVGLLDTGFFPGGYEDDDYCARVRGAGYEGWLARDVFIHHWGSASFGQFQREYFVKHARRNRAYLERKHGIRWEARPHAPFLSFAQDIAYALNGMGEHMLQLKYKKLWVEALSRLLGHYEKEFAALRNLLQNSEKAVPPALGCEIRQINDRGSLRPAWNDIVAEVDQGMAALPLASASVDAIVTKLTRLADAVRATALCNLKMHELLEAVGQNHDFARLVPGKTRGVSLLQALRKGTAFLRELRGVVIFGGYPSSEREADGYFQRIRAVDSLLTDRWRIYVEAGPSPSREGWYDRPARNTLVLYTTGKLGRALLVRLCVLLCVLRCRAIYLHSVLRIRDSGFGFLLRLPGITRVVDLHGAVPEEFRYYNNDFYNSWLHDRYERLAVRKADYVIVVSEAMRRYCEQKWQSAVRCRFITLPNVPQISVRRSELVPSTGKPVIAYAGGLHKWQQVPRMLDAVARTADRYSYRLFCPQPDEMRGMLPERLRGSPSIVIERKSHADLLQSLCECHYGLILREDNAVNRVACPTKLVEYAAMGVVPIAAYEEIGDFKALGMRFVQFEALITGQLPDETTRARMAQENLVVYNQLQDLYLIGARELHHALPLRRSGLSVHRRQLAAHAIDWGKRFLPLGTLRGSAARRVFRWIARRTQAIGRSDRIGGPPESASSIASKDDPKPSLPVCDILVQVSNFTAGGLENVALDVNRALVEAGWRVALLVLGEAGPGVRRAREGGTPVCVTFFDPEAYEQLLREACPKLVLSHYSTQGTTICSRVGIPFIQVIHNTYMWFSEDQAREFSEAAQHTAAFVAVSEFVKDYSVGRLGVPPEKCLVIPNGIDVGRVRELDFTAERHSLRGKYRFSTDDFVFLNVGAINHQKNHLGLVKAFRIALRDCPRANLVILGPIVEKQLLAEIEQYVRQHDLKSRVFFAGEVPDPYPYYAMADAFVGASFFEGGPLVLLEALATNLPIVITEVGFAGMFRGRKGISLVPPPVDVFAYRGHIWELRSTADFEERLAGEMRKTYAEGIKPDLPDNVVKMFGKRYAYNLYVSCVKQLLETGQIPLETPLSSWPALIKNSDPRHRD